MLTDHKLSYTVEEAATATGIPRNSLYRAFGDGSLRSFKSGRRRMVSSQALRDYLAKLERESAKGVA